MNAVIKALKQKQNSYTREELLSCGRGELFGTDNAQLPVSSEIDFG